MKILFSQDVAQLYPKETKLAEDALVLINTSLGVNLPHSEVTSIAMHFINSQSDFDIDNESQAIEELIEIMTQMIENQLAIRIEREEFNYQRFQAHVRYYLKRLREMNHLLMGMRLFYKVSKKVNLISIKLQSLSWIIFIKV